MHPDLMNLSLALLFFGFFYLSNAQKCGYESCDIGKPDMLNVHLVPHGHCDTGWDKTVDQYYYGSHNNIMNVGIQYNLDAIIQGLVFNKNRRFTWIEVAYFWRWWGEQNDKIKTIVKQLVNEGRLMFGNNGWNMNDEASAYYQEIIDQHTLGERFLMETFGNCGRPLTAWQIDTFGHSREMASLLAQMGHDSLYFARLDYQDKIQRIKSKQMELMWHGSDDLGASSDLFTGVLFNHYLPPSQFCYSCGDDPIMDDNRLFDFNVDQKIDLFIKEINVWASAFPTNHILIPMGSDFDYELANRWFKNEDKLIKYVNARQAKGSKINVLYSTIPCYTYAAHSANFSYTTKKDEFFPYASRDHTFWTGSFVSRPTLKGYVRDTNSFLQTAKQLSVLAGTYVNKETMDQIFLLSRGLAININHGQLPGTQTQAVAFDNALRMSNGTIEGFKSITLAYDKLTINNLLKSEHCTLLNISECSITENSDSFSVTFYNQLSWPVIHMAQIPVKYQYKVIYTSNNNTIVPDMIPILERTQLIPERKGNAKFNALFPAHLPPLGFATFYFRNPQIRRPTQRNSNNRWREIPPGQDYSIENNFIKLSFSGKTNQVTHITNLRTQQKSSSMIDLKYYTSFVGNNANGNNQASGAYIFRPNEETPWDFPSCKVKEYSGSEYTEVYQEYSKWATFVFRSYKRVPYIELEWTVGPIPFEDGNVGKEVVLSVQTSIDNNRTCYTDSNGRQMMKRMYDYRETWNFSNTEPVAGNYNPINSAIYIREEERKLQLALVVDRAMGGSSLKNGQFEIMLHRRLGVDDGLGVNQALNEKGADGKGLIARGRVLFLFDTIGECNQFMRKYMHETQHRPTVTASNYSVIPTLETTLSGLNRALPENVKILTLEGWKNGQVLLRLEHIFQKNEHPDLSKPVTVDLADLFSKFVVLSGEELSLGGALPKSQMTRLHWNMKGSENPWIKARPTVLTPANLIVTLQPMEIKTFALTIKFL